MSGTLFVCIASKAASIAAFGWKSSRVLKHKASPKSRDMHKYNLLCTDMFTGHVSTLELYKNVQQIINYIFFYMYMC
mgnify:CR=1 FL=1